MSDQPLSAVVEKTRAEAAIGSLRSEGVYDDDRSVYDCGAETVAIPVTDYPATTEVLEIVADEGEPRLRTLEDHLRENGWSESELDRAPASWAVIGSVILVEARDVPRPDEVGKALLAMHGSADTVVARGGIDGEHREPSGEVIAGEGDTETVHREHGTEYALDLAKVMFSPGNKAERARMGEIVSEGERVLDMFAGIGYFTLPMARNGAYVTAVERNPDSFQYLVENVVRNGVQDSVETYRADNRDVIAGGRAKDGETTPFEFERIVMGYYDAHEYLADALSVLAEGGVLHMHEATPSNLVPDRPLERLEAAVDEQGREIEHAELHKIKTHSEGVTHIVVDSTIV